MVSLIQRLQLNYPLRDSCFRDGIHTHYIELKFIEDLTKFLKLSPRGGRMSFFLLEPESMIKLLNHLLKRKKKYNFQY